VSADPHWFRILTEWMPGGNVIQYAKSNPEANRLGVVSLFAVSPPFALYSSISFSSLRSCLLWPTSTSSRSFMGISKA